MNNDQPTSAEFFVSRTLQKIKEYAHREPTKAVASAFGVGLLINLLPTRVVVGTFTIVGATLMRPILLSLGAAKAIELCCQKTSNHLNS